MQDRVLETQFGWPLYLSHTPNRRTIYNFPMQGNGAEMLRLATMRLCEAGIIPSMLVHDAILLEADSEEQIAHAMEIMEWAGATSVTALRSASMSSAWYRWSLPRQAPGCREDLGDDHAGATRGGRVAERTVTMTKPRRFVTAHGRRIEVEEVAIPGLENGKQKPSLGQRFAMLTEERLKVIGKGANGSCRLGHLQLPFGGQLEKPPAAGQTDERGAR